MKYGYARVSTVNQAANGNSLEAQNKELENAGAEKIYIDHFTGTEMNRPEFDKLHSELISGNTLIVTKLDRFARSVSQASDLITERIDSGVTINVLNLGILSNDSVSTLMRNIMLSFAQFERDMIVQRTQEGKAVARKYSDYHEGRPRKYSRIKLEGFNSGFFAFSSQISMASEREIASASIEYTPFVNVITFLRLW